MRLYLANVSFQKQLVLYALTRDRNGEYSEKIARQGTRQEAIGSGEQIQVAGDFCLEQIQEILDQLEPYGLVGEKDIPSGLNGNIVHALAFNIDQKISGSKLRELHEHNTLVRLGQGSARRQAAAITANQQLTNTVEETPRLFEVEYEQEETSPMGEKAIAEGFHLEPDITKISRDVIDKARARAGRA